jgi:sigma-B regulation protein RsbU (phosphoserine phosphatase)
VTEPDPTAPWPDRLRFVIDTVRELSAQTDPQRMVANYTKRVREIMPVDGSVSLSRRGYQYPDVRVTRASIWGSDVNPWKQKKDLVVHHGGLFAELIYADAPTIIDDLDIHEGDPTFPFAGGMRSLQAIPLFDQGVALNMVVTFRK